jgi:hypothetical protein
MEDIAMVMGLVMVLAMVIVILIATVTITTVMDINNLAVTGAAIVDHGVDPAISDEIKGQGE